MESGRTGPVPEASCPEVIREDLGSRRASESVLVHPRWSLPWRSFWASGRRLPVLWTHSVSFSAQLLLNAPPLRSLPGFLQLRPPPCSRCTCARAPLRKTVRVAE